MDPYNRDITDKRFTFYLNEDRNSIYKIRSELENLSETVAATVRKRLWEELDVMI